MSRLLSLAAAFAAAVLIAARRSPRPSRPSAPPTWVEWRRSPTRRRPRAHRRIQTLLDDNQSRLRPQGDAYYNRRAPAGAEARGPGGPHHLRRHLGPGRRGRHRPRAQDRSANGKTIDLLGKGQKMLVLRREQDLERAMLDGRMSATQQIEGLQVGDILDASWTTAGRDPVAGNRSYDIEGLAFPGVAGRYRVRLSWPDGDADPYRTTAGLRRAAIRASQDGWTYPRPRHRPTPGAEAAGGRPAAVPPGGLHGDQRLRELERDLADDGAALRAHRGHRPATADLRGEIDAIAAARTIPRNAPSPPCGWWRTRPATSSSASATAATCRPAPTTPGRASSATARARPPCCWPS